MRRIRINEHLCNKRLGCGYQIFEWNTFRDGVVSGECVPPLSLLITTSFYSMEYLRTAEFISRNQIRIQKMLVKKSDFFKAAFHRPAKW